MGNHAATPAVDVSAARGSLWRPWRWADETWERLGLGLFVGLLLAVTPYALYRILGYGASDFPEFYAAGRYVLEHGARQPNTILYYYLPSLDVAWALLAMLPFGVAAVVWHIVGCAAWVALLWVSAHFLLTHVTASKQRRAALAAGLLVIPLAMGHLCLGAFHILMLMFMVAGLGLAARDRWLSGGLLLGLAVWMKFLPGLGVAYLLLKRKWKAALAALALALVVDVVLSLAAYGPQAAWQYHVRWWKVDGFSTTDRLLHSPLEVPEHRFNNQSFPAVLRRTLSPLAVSRPGSVEPRLVNLMALEPKQIKWVYLGVLGTIAALVGLQCRRSDRRTTVPRWSSEIALVVLATLWLSPVVWSYHYTAATPALAVLLSRGPRYRPLALAMVPVWVAGVGLMGWSAALSYGVTLWTSILLGGLLVYTIEEPASDAACDAARLGGSLSARAA